MRHTLQRLKIVVIGVATLLFAFASGPVEAQDLAAFEKRMTEFTLDNGLKFLVIERHEVPVVSFHIHADVGAVDEVKGITGLAHLFEHMAFKGTKTIGTKNYEAEAKAMARMDELFDAIKVERRKLEPDPTHLEQLNKQFEAAQDEANRRIKTARCVRDYPEVYEMLAKNELNSTPEPVRIIPVILSVCPTTKSSCGCHWNRTGLPIRNSENSTRKKTSLWKNGE